MGVMRPELVMKSIVPVVMAGVLGIYGLIIAVIISTNSEQGGQQGRARTREGSGIARVALPQRCLLPACAAGLSTHAGCTQSLNQCSR